MGIFGWSYPPGCHSVPGDGPEPPCGLCGKDVDTGKNPCSCPECPTCGTCGCIEHLSNAELVNRLDRAEHIVWSLEQEVKQREKKMIVVCKKCENEIQCHLRSDDPDVWCGNCSSVLDLEGNVID